MRREKRGLISVQYIAVFVILICAAALVYDRFMIKRIKDCYDVKTSLVLETIPKDMLLKDYENYKALLKNNLSENEYKKEINKNSITEESFVKYDYVALFYETRTCSHSDSYPSNLSQFKNKIVLTVKRYENEDCDLETRISFVPVEKDKYDSLPNVVIKKEIIEK